MRMELMNNIIIPEKKGCNRIITLTPRIVLDQGDNHVIDIPTCIEPSCDSPSSHQEPDTQSWFDKLNLIKQELKSKLDHLRPEQASKIDHIPREQQLQQHIIPHHKSIYSRITPSKSSLKWTIIVLNVIIELIQAIYAQDLSSSQTSKANCGKLSVIMSSICLIISIVDIVLEAWEGEVKLRKRGICPWFYYPGKHGRPLGSLWTVFGLVSSMVQFGLSLMGYVTHGSGSVRFDYLPLLLAVCFLLAALGGGRKSMWVVVKCDIKHGEYEIEGRFVRGGWYFPCPTCETAVRSV